MKNFNYILISFVMLLASSCYEDLGNYDYNEDIHDISVKMKGSYGVRKGNGIMHYTIEPEIITVDGDDSYLKYVWTMRNNTTYLEDTLCMTRNAVIQLDTEANDFSYSYDLFLYVTDTKTGGETMVPTKLEIVRPYSYSWLVLHEMDNHAELGTVEYIAEEVMVLPDVYTQEHGTSFTGMPKNLSVVKNEISPSYWLDCSSPSQVYVTTSNPDESGWLNQNSQFKLMLPWTDLVKQEEASLIDFEQMKGSGDETGLMVLSKGNLFCGTYSSPFMVAIQPDDTFVGEYRITKAAAGPHEGVAYDEIGHRFVYVSLSDAYWFGVKPSYFYGVPSLYPVRTSGDNAGDPNKLPEGEKVINIVNGYWHDRSSMANWQRYSAYAYSLGENGKSYVYVFRYRGLSNEDTPPMPYRFTINTPVGIQENTPMASSWEYNNILFYAVGNEIYKLDFAAGQTTLVYTHPDVSAEIIELKMGVEGYSTAAEFNNGVSVYGHPFSRTLGAAVNTADGKGELVVLQLNSAGKIDSDKKFPSVQVHKGFGKITEIEFF